MSSLLLPRPSHPSGSYQPGSVDPALLRQPLSLRSLGKQTPDATAQVPAKPWPHLLCATAPNGRADGHQPGTQQPPIRQLVAPMCVLWHSSMRQPAVHSSFGHGSRPSPQLRCVLKLWLLTLSLASYCSASLRSVAMVAPILLPVILCCLLLCYVQLGLSAFPLHRLMSTFMSTCLTSRLTCRFPMAAGIVCLHVSARVPLLSCFTLSCQPLCPHALLQD